MNNQSIKNLLIDMKNHNLSIKYQLYIDMIDLIEYDINFQSINKYLSIKNEKIKSNLNELDFIIEYFDFIKIKSIKSKLINEIIDKIDSEKIRKSFRYYKNKSNIDIIDIDKLDFNRKYENQKNIIKYLSNRIKSLIEYREKLKYDYIDIENQYENYDKINRINKIISKLNKRMNENRIYKGL
jgi:hypothetical protein